MTALDVLLRKWMDQPCGSNITAKTPFNGPLAKKGNVRSMQQGKAATVEGYLAGVQNPAFRQALEDLRLIIRSEMPDAEEVISYGIPTFKLDGSVLHFGAFARHCSLFLGTMTEEFEAELRDFKTSKGTIQFTPENPLPEDLVRRMVRRSLHRHLALLEERRAKRAKPTK